MSNLSAPLPANSPYRCDVPSGVWDTSEYEKLPGYDAATADQPARLFLCHQQDGRICAGWAGCHDMNHNLAARVAVLDGQLTPDEYQQLLDYEAGVPLFDSGQGAADHGRADGNNPGRRARQMVRKLRHRQTVHTQQADSSAELDQV